MYKKKPFIYYAVHTLSKTKLKDVLIEEKPLIYKSFQQKEKDKSPLKTKLKTTIYFCP